MREETIAVLYSVPDVVWGFVDLSRDPVYERLPPEAHRFCVQMALEIGSAAAFSEKDTFSGDARAWAEGLGMRIVEIHEGVTVQGAYAFPAGAELDLGLRAVILHGDHIEALTELLNRAGLNVQPETVAGWHVMHEGFHFLESSRLGWTFDRLARLDAGESFRLPARIRVRRTSEIAAHRFVKDLAGLSFLPCLLDWLWAYRHEPLALVRKVVAAWQTEKTLPITPPS
ncbi:MAG: hypothetical protein HPY55_07660 [Firmicutes bacterium]|nr:hypothetical protein [Bacillota bacterium]